jgi:hypothetical protein
MKLRAKRCRHLLKFISASALSCAALAQAPAIPPNRLPAGISIGPLERISLTPSGAEPNAATFAPSLSADGRFVLFSSRASNYLPGMPDPAIPSTCANPILYQWYVLDRQTRSLERVSVNSAGEPAKLRPNAPGCSDIGSRHGSSISVDGRYVSFNTLADNLVLGDTNNNVDTYRYDRIERTIKRITVGLNGEQFSSTGRAFTQSGDGRYYAFVCSALLGLSLENSTFCLRDLENNSITAIKDQLARPINESEVLRLTLSGDGKFAVFLTSSPTLIPGGGNGFRQAIRLDLTTGAREILSIRQDGGLSTSVDFINAQEGNVIAVNWDASVVAFPCADAGSAEAGFNSVYGVWRQATGQMESPIDDLLQEPRGFVTFPSISADGDLMVFSSIFDLFNSFGGESRGVELWLRRNRGIGLAGRFVRRLDRTYTKIGHGEQRTFQSFPFTVINSSARFQNNPVISADGSMVAFSSRDPFLVEGDVLLADQTLDNTTDGTPSPAIDVFVARIFDADKVKLAVQVPISQPFFKVLLALCLLMAGIWAVRR